MSNARADYEDLPDTVRRHGLSVSDYDAAQLLSAAIHLLRVVDKIDVSALESASVTDPVSDVDLVEARETLRVALETWENNR